MTTKTEKNCKKDFADINLQIFIIYILLDSKLKNNCDEGAKTHLFLLQKNII